MTWQLEVNSGPDKGSKAVILADGLIIGREPSKCHLLLSDEKSSRLHATVKFSAEGQVMLEDLGSTHGTMLNGSPVNRRTRLNPGDSIKIGDSTIVLKPIQALTDYHDQTENSALSSISIGRNPDNDLVLSHPAVSRSHAQLDKKADSFYLTALTGSTGTYLNDQPVKGTVRLEPFSRIRIHDSIFTFDGTHLLDGAGHEVASFLPAEQKSDHAVFQARLLLEPFSRQGIVKWLLGSILAVIPVVEFLAGGYRYRLLKNGQAGNITLPEWDNWGDLIKNGLLFTLIRYSYILLPAFVTYMLIRPMLESTDNPVTLPATAIPISVTAYLVTFIFLPMSLAQFAFTGQFKEAYNFPKILYMIKTVFQDYIIALILLSAMWLAVLLLSLIPAAGIILGALGVFYIYMVSGLLFGQIHSKSCQNSKKEVK